MLRIGLWNTNLRVLAPLLHEWATQHALNVLVLLECGVPLALLLETLNAQDDALWFPTRGLCSRVTVLTRFPEAFIIAEAEGELHTIRRVKLPGIPEILLCGVHLHSRLRMDEASLSFAAVELARAVEDVETRRNHQRTVLVGDFNMDPYEHGMVAANALHGMMSSRSARKRTRTIDKRDYSMFYNPMWAYLGERHGSPPGTYRYWSAKHVLREWHAFDQVLLRPQLIDWFPPGELRVLDRIGQTSLVSAAGYPAVSDHLPLVFELREPRWRNCFYEPAELEVSLAVEREIVGQSDALDRHWKVRIEQASYEIRRAERRYKAVDPDNRVVARTLEREWEQYLEQLEQVTRQRDEARRQHVVELARKTEPKFAPWHATSRRFGSQRRLCKRSARRCCGW
jgi:hypothetical protein